MRQSSGKSQTYLGKSLGKSQISGDFAYLFTILIFLYSLSSTNLYLFSCYFYMHLNCASMYDPRTCFLITQFFYTGNHSDMKLFLKIKNKNVKQNLSLDLSKLVGDPMLLNIIFKAKKNQNKSKRASYVDFREVSMAKS